MCAILIATAPVALAQGAPSNAERLFDEGRDAMQRHDYVVACQRFVDSNLAEPALGTQLNLANCEEQRGRVATASQLFRRVREQLAPGDSRISAADEHLAALEPRLPHVRIVWTSDAPAGTRVQIDGSEVAHAAPFASVAVDPGPHNVLVAQPSKGSNSKQIELREGQLLELRVPFATAAAPEDSARPDDSVPPTRATEPDGIHAGRNRTAAYVVGGVGVASLIAGVVTGVMGLHQESIGDANCSDATRTCTQTGVGANDAARSLATVSSIALVVGIVGTGVGTYLYLTAAPPQHGAALTQIRPLSVGWVGTW